MASRLRMGVIGLGRRWPRYRRALLALERDVCAVAVHDPSLEHAEEEARSLGCEAVAGVFELTDRRDVDAVLVPGGAWHGLWGVEQAVAAGKPVLCAVSPVEDEAHVDRLREAAGVHVELWPSLMFVREALTERLQDTLGRPLFLQATWTRGGDGDLLATPAALALLRACADLIGASPRRVDALPSPGTIDVANLLLEFDDERVAQLTLWGSPAGRSSCRIQIEAEGGSARAELPRLVEWIDAEGRHTHTLPGGLAEALVLERFVQAVRDGEPPACSFSDACEALDWVRTAREALA